MTNPIQITNPEEPEEMSVTDGIIHDFISAHPYIASKKVGGKLFCDNCKCFLPAIHPMYVKAHDGTEEIFCYPCDYKRNGTSSEELYRNKRSDNNIQSVREQNMEQSKVYQIARGILVEIAPFCSRAYIAGSLRRMKSDPKDIELVVSPVMIESQDGLFETKKFRSKEFISKVSGLGKILKGKPADGRYVCIELGGGLKLDLFIPQESDFVRQYVIRTGSKEFIKNTIASGWRKLGWVGTDDGLRLMSECEKKGEDKWICIASNPTLPPIFESEEEFFKWLNIEFVKPENRN